MEGYTVGGKKGGAVEFEVKCLATDELTAPKVCEPVKCGTAPRVPKSRAAIAGDVFYGMHLEYLCDLGYTLDGGASGPKKFPITCQKDGTFTALPSEQPCKPVCKGRIPTITNAKLTEYG